MKILWVVNPIFPELAKTLGIAGSLSGGWMFGLAKDIAKNGNNLVVVTAKHKSKEFHETINGIDYYILNSNTPTTEYDLSLEAKWQKVIKEVNPDIVHIHGMEYAHGLSLVKSFNNLNYVISIQGILSECYRYYTGQISPNEIRKSKTFRDYVKNDGIIEAKKKYGKRARMIEDEYYKFVSNIMGRSQWDKDHSQTQNPNSTYYRCNDSLRDSFYNSDKWNINTKSSHTIFLSQAMYPLKGLHKVLEAIYLIKNNYPKLKVRIAGDNIIKTNSVKDRFRRNGYGQYIFSLIKKFNLFDIIEFTGPLNENEMVKEFLNTNVFISPSSIENCSNSVGEAQLLGVPCIASYVGGVPDMITHNETGLLYRFDAIEMLAQRIKDIFDDNELAIKLSKGGLQSALLRHDRKTNLKTILDIYKKIIN